MDKHRKRKGRQNWLQVKDSFHRRGAYIPEFGWRSASRSAVHIEKDRPPSGFDEVLSFANSEIGELASPIASATSFLSSKDSLGKNVQYFVYGFSSYVAVVRPCRSCTEKNIKNCNCSILVDALKHERKRILENIKGNTFFHFDLTRNFRLKKSANYGRYPRVEFDSFTDEFANDNILVSGNSIDFDVSRVFPSVTKVKDFLDKSELTIEDYQCDGILTDDKARESEVEADGATDGESSSTDTDDNRRNETMIANDRENDHATVTRDDSSDDELTGLPKEVPLVVVLPSATDTNNRESAGAKRPLVPAIPSDMTGSKTVGPPAHGIKNQIMQPIATIAGSDGVMGERRLEPKRWSIGDSKMSSIISGKIQNKSESEFVYPSNITAYCYQCFSSSMFMKGKCTRCNTPFHLNPQATRGAYSSTRYSPYFPESMVNADRMEQEDFTRESLFRDGQVKRLKNSLIFVPLQDGDKEVHIGSRFMSSESKVEAYMEFESYFQEQDPITNTEKFKFVQYGIFRNLEETRRKHFDPLFALHPNTLFMCWNGETHDLGPQNRFLAPLGLPMMCVMHDVGEKLESCLHLFAKMFDEETYPTDLTLKFSRSQNCFFENKSGKWEKLRPHAVFYSSVAPFLNEERQSARTVFLQILYDHMKTIGVEERSQRGLPGDVTQQLKQMLDTSICHDKEKQKARLRHPFLAEMGIPHSEPHYMERYDELYKKHYKKFSSQTTPAIAFSPKSFAETLTPGRKLYNPKAHSTPASDGNAHLEFGISSMSWDPQNDHRPLEGIKPLPPRLEPTAPYDHLAIYHQTMEQMEFDVKNADRCDESDLRDKYAIPKVTQPAPFVPSEADEKAKARFLNGIIRKEPVTTGAGNVNAERMEHERESAKSRFDNLLPNNNGTDVQQPMLQPSRGGESGNTRPKQLEGGNHGKDNQPPPWHGPPPDDGPGNRGWPPYKGNNGGNGGDDGGDDPQRRRESQCCCVHQMDDRQIRKNERLQDLQEREQSRARKQVDDKHRQDQQSLAMDLKLLKIPEYDPNKYQSFRDFYSIFRFKTTIAVPLDERRKKTLFADCFMKHKPTIVTHIQNILEETPDITTDDLASQVAFFISSDTKAHYENELEKLERIEDEEIDDYSFRTERILNETIPPKEFYSFRKTELYQQQLLHYFLRGLRNDALRQEIKRKGATTLKMAVFIAKEFVEQKQSCILLGQRDSSKLTMAAEVDIAQGKKTKKRAKTKDVNLIDKVPEIEECYDDEVSANAVQSAAFKTPNAGFNVGPSHSTSAVPQDIYCYHCGRKGHFKSSCPEFNSAAKPSPQKVQAIIPFTPAQQRNAMKKTRFFKGNKVNNIDVEDEDDEETYGEVFSEDEAVNNLDRDQGSPSEGLLEQVNDLVNVVSSLKSKFESRTQNASKSKPYKRVNRITTKFHPSSPYLQTVNLGRLSLDSGSEVSCLPVSRVPHWADILPAHENLMSLTGKTMTIKEKAIIFVVRTPRGLAISKKRNGMRLEFLIVDDGSPAILGWKDMHKLNIEISCISRNRTFNRDQRLEWHFAMGQDKIRVWPEMTKNQKPPKRKVPQGCPMSIIHAFDDLNHEACSRTNDMEVVNFLVRSTSDKPYSGNEVQQVDPTMSLNGLKPKDQFIEPAQEQAVAEDAITINEIAANPWQPPESYNDNSDELDGLTPFTNEFAALSYGALILVVNILSFALLLTRKFDAKILQSNRQLSHLAIAMLPFNFMASYLLAASMELTAQATCNSEKIMLQDGFLKLNFDLIKKQDSHKDGLLEQSMPLLDISRYTQHGPLLITKDSCQFANCNSMQKNGKMHLIGQHDFKPVVAVKSMQICKYRAPNSCAHWWSHHGSFIPP